MRNKRLVFENPHGEKLSAVLGLPLDEKPAAYALFAHCFTCSKDLKPILNISRAMTGHGIGVMRFDFTGLGESEGDFADTNFSSNVADLIAGADFMKAEHGAPRILIGHSLGGAAVLQAASGIPSAVAVATIAAPYEPAYLGRLLSPARETLEKQGETEVTIAGRTFRIKKQFLHDLERVRMENTIRNLGKALLILHSPADSVVGIENAEKIFQAARHPKSFVSLDQADHLLLDENDSRYVGEVIAAWSRKALRY